MVSIWWQGQREKEVRLTVNSIQGWELMMTQFDTELGFWESQKLCGGGRKGYWNPESARKLSVMGCGCYGM